MSYRELRAPAALAGLVECGWTDTATADGAHQVLPDGCMDLVWTGADLLVAVLAALATRLPGAPPDRSVAALRGALAPAALGPAPSGIARSGPWAHAGTAPGGLWPCADTTRSGLLTGAGTARSGLWTSAD